MAGATKAAASKAGASKSTASRGKGTRASRSRSAPTAARTGNAPGTVVASGRQTAEAAAAEREAVTPVQASGPGSGSRLLSESGKALSMGDIAGAETDTLVTITEDVHEEHPAPGAPGKTIRTLLFHKGQRVPKSTLERHFEQQAAQAKSRSSRRSSENKSSQRRVTGHK